MKFALAAAAATLALIPAAASAATAVKHFSAPSTVPGQASPPFSSSVMAGDTLYISGMLDSGPGGKMGANAEESSRFVLDNLKRAVELAGLTMDDLVLVELYGTDLGYYPKFNEIYRTYFKGPNLPARAFIGTSQLLNGAHFEIKGIAVKSK